MTISSEAGGNAGRVEHASFQTSNGAPVPVLIVQLHRLRCKLARADAPFHGTDGHASQVRHGVLSKPCFLHGLLHLPENTLQVGALREGRMPGSNDIFDGRTPRPCILLARDHEFTVRLVGHIQAILMQPLSRGGTLFEQADDMPLLFGILKDATLVLITALGQDELGAFAGEVA